jgi:hypothetical protein
MDLRDRRGILLDVFASNRIWRFDLRWGGRQ